MLLAPPQHPQGAFPPIPLSKMGFLFLNKFWLVFLVFCFPDLAPWLNWTHPPPPPTHPGDFHVCRLNPVTWFFLKANISLAHKLSSSRLGWHFANQLLLQVVLFSEYTQRNGDFFLSISSLIVSLVPEIRVYLHRKTRAVLVTFYNPFKYSTVF